MTRARRLRPRPARVSGSGGRHPRRQRKGVVVVELFAGVALMGSAVGVAVAGGSPNTAEREPVADVEPISLGAAGARAPAAPPQDPSPYRLRIPELEVDASIVAVEVDDEGVLGIPADPLEVGWWSEGPAPGTGRGTSIIAGHVNTAALGPGALAAVDRLDPGDTIYIEGWGAPREFEVETVQIYDKSELPASAFDQRVEGRLAIVSCSGLDEETGEYRENLIVYAAPVDQPTTTDSSGG